MSAKSSGGGNQSGKEGKGERKGAPNSENGGQVEAQIVYEHRHLYLTKESLEPMTIVDLEDLLFKTVTIPHDMVAFIRELIKVKKQKKVLRFVV
jgi:hypothetical protein